MPDYGADAVVVATGSLPSEDGFQRALPHVERLPGVESGNVVAVDDVMGRSAHPGRRVIVLDDLGHWHGDAAEVVNLLNGETTRIEADTLVTATVGEAQTWLADTDTEVHAIGDCVAPRLAAMAIYGGRDLAQGL